MGILAGRIEIGLDPAFRKRLEKKMLDMNRQVTGRTAPEAMLHAAGRLEEKMRSKAPVDTGALRSSIKTNIEYVEGQVSDYFSLERAAPRVWYSAKVGFALTVGTFFG